MIPDEVLVLVTCEKKICLPTGSGARGRQTFDGSRAGKRGQTRGAAVQS